jgi:hypothetical protein
MTLGEKATLIITPYVTTPAVHPSTRVHYTNHTRDTVITHMALGKFDLHFAYSVVGTRTTKTGCYRTWEVYTPPWTRTPDGAKA